MGVQVNLEKTTGKGSFIFHSPLGLGFLNKEVIDIYTDGDLHDANRPLLKMELQQHFMQHMKIDMG